MSFFDSFNPFVVYVAPIYYLCINKHLNMCATAVIFDMDDTLYKECDYRSSGWHAVASCFAASCKTTPEALFQEMSVNPAYAFETVRDMAASNGVDVSVDMQLNVYRAHRPDIALNKCAIELLNTLRHKGIPTGVITDGRPIGQLNKIAALKLSRFMDGNLIMPTALYNTDKHSSTPFKIMMQRLPHVSTFVYVGDNPEKDFIHPNRLGWITIMLADNSNCNIHSQNLYKWPEENRPKHIVNSLADILQIIKPQ